MKQFPQVFVQSNSIRAATAKGYSFDLHETIWVLDKNWKIDLSWFHANLESSILEGFLSTLAFYASKNSGAYTFNLAIEFKNMIVATKTKEISDATLVNYRSSLGRSGEWHLAKVRIFLKKWYELGYASVSENVIQLLYTWRLKNSRKGDVVKRLDPTKGPLTNNELQAFNYGIFHLYEQGRINLSEFAIALIVSHTGRRSIQVSHLRVLDIWDKKGEPFYKLNIPRCKNGRPFRTEFKTFAITQELCEILSAQAENAITSIEDQIGFPLQGNDRQQVPLFPDDTVLSQIDSLNKYRALMATDELHSRSTKILNAFRSINRILDVVSERTGEKLHVNPRRFRYTIATRAAREGYGEFVIAEILDHTDTQSAGIYVKNIPEHVENLDKAVGYQLIPYAQAFLGVLVDNENDAKRGKDPSSRIRIDIDQYAGTCGEYGFCDANVPIPCYTCYHFQPWLDGPHEEVYQRLLSEKGRIQNITGDNIMAEALDRSILAVADVIQRCKDRRIELENKNVEKG